MRYHMKKVQKKSHHYIVHYFLFLKITLRVDVPLNFRQFFKIYIFFSSQIPRILKIADISASILDLKKKTIRDSLIKMFHSFYIIKFLIFIKCDTKHFRLESLVSTVNLLKAKKFRHKSSKYKTAG